MTLWHQKAVCWLDGAAIVAPAGKEARTLGAGGMVLGGPGVRPAVPTAREGSKAAVRRERPTWQAMVCRANPQ